MPNCTTVEQLAVDARSGDYLLCPFVGAVPITTVELIDGLVNLVDAAGLAHVYHPRQLLRLARPN